MIDLNLNVGWGELQFDDRRPVSEVEPPQYNVSPVSRSVTL